MNSRYFELFNVSGFFFCYYTNFLKIFQDCAPGYIRKLDGEWKGKCVLQEITCPTGYYGNPTRGIECQICPCPTSANSNQ